MAWQSYIIQKLDRLFFVAYLYFIRNLVVGLALSYYIRSLDVTIFVGLVVLYRWFSCILFVALLYYTRNLDVTIFLAQSCHVCGLIVLFSQLGRTTFVAQCPYRNLQSSHISLATQFRWDLIKILRHSMQRSYRSHYILDSPQHLIVSILQSQRSVILSQGKMNWLKQCLRLPEVNFRHKKCYAAVV